MQELFIHLTQTRLSNQDVFAFLQGAGWRFHTRASRIFFGIHSKQRSLQLYKTMLCPFSILISCPAAPWVNSISSHNKSKAPYQTVFSSHPALAPDKVHCNKLPPTTHCFSQRNITVMQAITLKSLGSSLSFICFNFLSHIQIVQFLTPFPPPTWIPYITMILPEKWLASSVKAPLAFNERSGCQSAQPLTSRLVMGNKSWLLGASIGRVGLATSAGAKVFTCLLLALSWESCAVCFVYISRATCLCGFINYRQQEHSGTC